MKWMECEAISFNDVQDKSAWQQLLRQCVQQPRGKAQRQHRQAVMAYTAGFMWGTCHWPVHSIVSTGNMFVWCQFWGWKQITSHRTETYPMVSQPRTSIYWVIFLPSAVSHFNSDSLFEECSFTHYQVLPLQHNVTGICGLSDRLLYPQTWG